MKDEEKMKRVRTAFVAALTVGVARCGAVNQDGQQNPNAVESNKGQTLTVAAEKSHGVDTDTYNKFLELKQYFDGYDKSLNDMKEDLKPEESETMEKRKKREDFANKLEELRNISSDLIRQKIAGAFGQAKGKSIDPDEIEFGITENGHFCFTYQGTTFKAPYAGDSMENNVMPLICEETIAAVDRLGEALGHEHQQTTPDDVLNNKDRGVNGKWGLIDCMDALVGYEVIIDEKGNMHFVSYEEMDNLINNKDGQSR